MTATTVLALALSDDDAVPNVAQQRQPPGLTFAQRQLQRRS